MSFWLWTILSHACRIVWWCTGVQNPQVLRPRLQFGTGGHVILHSHGARKSWKATGDVFVRVKQHLGYLLELFNNGSKLILWHVMGFVAEYWLVGGLGASCGCGGGWASENILWVWAVMVKNQRYRPVTWNIPQTQTGRNNTAKNNGAED